MGERRWSAALRAELVRLARAGRRVEDLAAEYGPSPSMIRAWVRADRAGQPVPAAPPGLAVTHPHLAAQVDPDRNPDVDPARLTAGSTRKLWWRCPAGHVWQAQIAARTRGTRATGCPTCAGHYPAGIATTHPALAAELDPDRNPDVDPDRLTAGSERKVWWQCPQGHVWQAPVVRRSQGTGCPTCAHHRLADHLRRLAATRTYGPGITETHPHLAAQVDPLWNPGVDPARLTAGSGRTLWWRCPHGHTWQATVVRRVQGGGCPVCSGHRPGLLAATHPALAGELDPDHNPPDLTGERIHAGSHGLVWWRCPAGHAWQDTPLHRAQGAGCPTCQPAPASKRRLCTFVYTDPARQGTRCRGGALPGSEWCSAHQAEAAHARRCTATTQTGRRCAQPAEPGQTTCAVHDPARQPAGGAHRVAASPAAERSEPSPGERLPCPGCSRPVGIHTITTDADGQRHIVLYAHRNPDGQPCPTRIVTTHP